MEQVSDPESKQRAAKGKTPADLVVSGGRVVTPTGVVEGAVVIRDGVIERIAPAGSQHPATSTIDVAGQYVFPGLIDSHVHFRTPGLEHKEDWWHGSRAAITGGVTTVVDMPNTRPPSLTSQALIEKARVVNASSWVDYAFHLGADPENPQVLATAARGVASSVKVFMAGHHTAPVVFRDPAALSAAFSAAARTGVRLVVHAEDQSVFDLIDRVHGEPTSYREYERSRPRSAGIVAVVRIIDLVRCHGTKVHVLHPSCEEEVDLLVAAAAEGLPISFEVTGHHLSFTDQDTCWRGSRTRLSPALRTDRDRQRLWRAIIRREAATLGSDHAPHTLEEKSLEPAQAPPGLPGVQELATVVWTGLTGQFPAMPLDEAAGHLARVMGSGPAQLFSLTGKGRLVPGADADLAVFDPTVRWQLTPDLIQAKCGWSAYEGWVLTGRFTTVVQRGELAWDLARGFQGQPRGRWLAGPRRPGRPLTAAMITESGPGTTVGYLTPSRITLQDTP